MLWQLLAPLASCSMLFVGISLVIGLEGQSLTQNPGLNSNANEGVADGRHNALGNQIDQASARLRQGNRQSWAQDWRGIQSGFQGFAPFIGTFRPHDYERNRALVRQAFTFLAQAEVAGLGDAAFLGGVANGYGFLGDYSLQPGLRNNGFGPGAGFAFQRAGRLGRGLVIGGYGRRFDRDFERFALGWATQSLLFNGIYPFRMQRQEEPYVQPPIDPREPIKVARVDAASLNDTQKAAWDDLRGEAVAVAARVNETLTNLDLLAARLRARGMQPNSNDVATAFRMQSFLEEANERLQAKEFDKAKAALEKAEYERRRLKGVAAQ
jgi:hypothetical protein